MRSHLLKITLMVILSSFTMPREAITVYMIGDSTMSVKDPGAYPETGWGMPFANFFDASVKIDNRAKNGRSTRTFISENLWEPVRNSLKEGDYVFIQFGHNDEVKEKIDRYTSPEQYKTNLSLFVKETRSKKAIPILLTPVTRRRFENGKITETHEAYSALVRQTAQELGVVMLDIDKKSRELLQQFGPENSKLLFLQLEPGEHPNYPEGKIDNTHFNEFGARKIAQLVLAELRAQNIPLSDRIVNSAALPSSQTIKDTSFTIYSAYVKELKKYPFIKIAEPELSEGSGLHLNLKFKSSSDRQLLADIYYPKINNRMFPAILMIHGGGWKSGDKSQMAAIGKELANKGFVAVSAEYRLSPEAKYPAALHDLRDALKWIKSVSKKYSIDTSKIAVLGVSAGGQLAALLATTNGSNSVGIKAVVNIDGILAFHHPESEEGKVASEWLGGSYSEKQSVWSEASALTHAGPDTPPLLFINSQHQRFHAGRDDLIKKISPYGIYTEVHTLPDTPHTFWLFQPWFEPAVSHVVTFLNKIFA